MSVGGLLRSHAWQRLARRSRGKVYIPSGAVAGLDAVKAMARGGLTIDEMLKEAGAGVERASAHKQVPWVNSSYRGKFYLEHPTVETTNVVVASAAPATRSFV